SCIAEIALRGGQPIMLRLDRSRPRLLLLPLLVVLAAPLAIAQPPPDSSGDTSEAQSGTEPKAEPKAAVATFAGGCFWCVEEAFEKVSGVLSAVSGYTGGSVPNPTYEQVTYERTGHFEAVRVTYDPVKVSYEQLVDWFWRNIDPTQGDGQFCDH